MARKPRIEYEGAFYHVITRGNQRQQIFKGTEDLQRYLTIVADYKLRYNYFLYSYVLMSTHVHLLIETQRIPLSKILQGINQSYTMYFNRRYQTVGHLFQGRYKAILCHKDAYLLSLVKYIHLNPIRAKVVKTLDGYRWSSHMNYIGRTNREKGIVDTEPVLKMFSEDKARAKRAYRVYMGERESLRREEVYATVDQRVLGDEQFVEEVVERIGKSELRGRRRHAYALWEIGGAVEGIYGASLKRLRGRGKDEVLRSGRKVMSLVAKEYGYKGQEIAECLGRDPSVITRYLREGKRFGTQVEKVHEILKKTREEREDMQ